MTGDGPGDKLIEDIFQPLPDRARRNIEGLRQPQPEASTNLPDWARTLITHHSVLDVGLAELESLGLTNIEANEDVISVAYEGVGIDFMPGGQAAASVATATDPAADGWMFPRITDYWDERVGAIDAAGKRLEALGKEDRAAALLEIEESIKKHEGVLNDEFLVSAAVSFVDDLYKCASNIDRWDENLLLYLNASATTFSRQLNFRGIRLQSLVDNAWDDPSRLIQLFPDWFQAAGIVYVCPQVLVRNLARRDGIESEEEISGLVPQYIDEARQVADTLIAQCQNEHRHFVLVDTDAVETSFDQARKFIGTVGVLTMIRSEPPAPGSNVSVASPKGIAFPPAGL